MKSIYKYSFTAVWIFLCSEILHSQKIQYFEYEIYDVIKIDLQNHRIEIFWKTQDDSLIGTFEKLNDFLFQKDRVLLAAMNGGIYEPGFIPTGLFIEDGVEVRPINLTNGLGNFYLKPNGIFLVTDKEAKIVESGVFSKIKSQNIRFAIQSGPLLVNQDEIHPTFNQNSDSKFIRNGIGIDDSGFVFMVMTKSSVNLFDFSEFFRDSLGCGNALYLDGAISGMYIPHINRDDPGNYATIIGVIK